MTKDTPPTHMQEYEPDYRLDLEDYQKYVGEAQVQELKRLADPLLGKSWANVNSTLIGGGVAEILRGAIPLARAVGVDAHWYVIEGNQEFFRVTKKFHNMLQGIELPISLEEIFHAYLHTIDENAKRAFISADLVVIHDPQPAALVINGGIFGNTLWRCHIDTSKPDEIVWRFLLPYINHCAGAIFTMPEFVGPGLQIPIYQIMPCIDPMAPKNHQYTDNEALDTLSPLFDEHDIDPDRPIIAAVSRYDIHKNQATVIKAFKTLRETCKPSPAPYLIFLGNTASDDPEGDEMLMKLRDLAGDDPDIVFWVNVQDNDHVVGSLMCLARMFVHVSTKEGFGLVVTEALWQGTPVIGSKIGGIVRQVLEGQTGFLVDPLDEQRIAKRMHRLLGDPDEAEELGKRGREHVRKNFLLPRLVKNYVQLMRYYTGVDELPPEFRQDDLSYSEVIQHIRRRSHILTGNNHEL